MNKILNNSVIFIIVFLGLLGSLFAASSNDVEDVYVTFCNDDSMAESLKKLEFGEINPDLPFEICINIENRGGVDLPLMMNFVDGVMTSDGQHIACKDETASKKGFSSFVNFVSDKEFVLASNSKVTKKAILKYPKHFSGDSFGCLTYFIGEQTETKGALNVLVRKANVISASVNGKVNVKVKFSKSKVNNYEEIVKSMGNGDLVVKQNLKSDEVYSEILVKNDGNVKMEINFVSDIFSEDGKVSSLNGSIFLLPGENKVISSGKVIPTFSNGDFDFKTKIGYRVASDLNSEIKFEEFSKSIQISKIGSVAIVTGSVSIFALIGMFFLFVI